MSTQPGTYSATVASGTTSKSSKRKTPQVVIELDIHHRMSENGAWESIVPFKASMYLFLTDKAWEMTCEKLEAIGFNGNWKVMGFGSDTFRVECSNDPTYGDRWDLESWGGEPESLEEKELMQLQARWKASHAAPAPAPPSQAAPAEAAPAAAPAATSAATPPPPTDDGIPF